MPRQISSDGDGRSVDPERIGQGLWGPQGSQAVPPVQSARLRTLFHSRAMVTTSRVLLATALAVISWKSLAPAPDILNVTNVDKVLHFVAYCGVAGLAVSARPFSGLAPCLLLAVGLAVTWGAALELLQAAMAMGREGSWGDIGANTAGAIVGGGLAAWALRRTGRAPWVEHGRQRLPAEASPGDFSEPNR